MADPKLKFILEVDDKGSAKVKSFGGAIDTAGSKSKKFSTHLKGIATSAAKAVGKLLALGAAAATAIAGFTVHKILAQFAEFETALTRLKNLGVEDLGAVKAAIMALPAELGSATEMVNAYYQVLSAGAEEGAEAMELLVTSAKLAKVSFLEQETAVKALSSYMDAYSISAGEAADSLMKIEEAGKTTVKELAAVWGEIASLGKSAGISMDALAAAMAAVTQSGIGTEKSATQLKAVLFELISPTKQMSDLFAKWGGTMGALEAIGLEGVLRKIAEATGGAADKIKGLTSSQEAALAITALLANEMGNFNTALAAQKEKTGALAESWDAFKGTLSAVWDTFKSTVGKIAIEIGEKLALKVKEALGAIAEKLKENERAIVAWAEKWIEKIPDVAKWIEELDFNGLATRIENFAKNAATAVEGIAKLATGMATLAGWIHDIAKYTGMGPAALILDIQGDAGAGPKALTAAVEDAKSALKTIAVVDLEPVEIEVDTAKAEREVGGWVEYYDKVTGELKRIEIDADAAKAEREVGGWVEYHDKVTGELKRIEIDADAAKAEREVGGWVEWYDQTTGELKRIEVDADAALAEKVVDDFHESAESKPVELSLDITGAESNLNSLVGKLSDFSSKITTLNEKKLTPQVDVGPLKTGMDMVYGEIGNLENELDDLNDLVVSPSLKLKTSGFHSRVNEAEAKLSQLEAAVSKFNAISATGQIYLDTTSAVTAVQTLRAELEKLKSAMDEVGAAQKSSRDGEYDYGTSAREAYWERESAGRELYWATHAVGTGRIGLAESGMFEGHAGEIMLSPKASKAVRQYGIGSTGDIARMVSGHTPGDLAKMGSALSGLPKTGLYYGAEGQIIFNPAQSARIRLGNAGGGGRGYGAGYGTGRGIGFIGSYQSGTMPTLGSIPSGGNSGGASGIVGPGRDRGNINITVAPQMMTGDRQAALSVAMIIKEEIEQIKASGR